MANLGSDRTTVVLCDLLRSGRIGAGRGWAGPGFIARLRLALGPRFGNLSGFRPVPRRLDRYCFPRMHSRMAAAAYFTTPWCSGSIALT